MFLVIMFLAALVFYFVWKAFRYAGPVKAGIYAGLGFVLAIIGLPILFEQLNFSFNKDAAAAAQASSTTSV